MDNLPFGGGQQSERIANTAFVARVEIPSKKEGARKGLSPKEESAAHQLVGGVKAHQGEDG